MATEIEVSRCPNCGARLKDNKATWNFSEAELWDGEQVIEFTKFQAEIVDLLWRRQPRYVAHETLYEHMYQLTHEDTWPNPESMKVNMHNIRKRLEGSRVSICVKYGFGWSLQV